jgi:PAS domain S-box-containing protein
VIITDLGEVGRRVAENVPAILAYLDVDLRIVFVNRHCHALLGYAQTELVGRSMAEMVDPSTLRYAQAHAAQLDDGTVAACDYVLRHKDGSKRLLQVRAMSDRDGNGRRRGFYACTFDAFHWRPEVEARWRLKRRRRPAEPAGTGRWEWDPIANRTSYSDGFCSLLGYAKGTLPRKFKLFTALHPDDAERVVDAIAAGIECGGFFVCKSRVRCADGTYTRLFMRVDAVMNAASGEVERICGVLTEDACREAGQK